MTGQRVIAINRFYWPDHSATSQLLTDLAEQLATLEAEVIVITSRLRYDGPSQTLDPVEAHRGVRVKRIWTTRFGRGNVLGRAIDYITFYVSALFCLIATVKKNDVVIAKTDPPMISVVAAFAVKLRKATLINWCQDIFPEIAGALGITWSKGPIGKVLIAVRNWSLRSAKVNVVLDPDMALRVRGFGVRDDQIEIIENWCDRNIRPIPRSENTLAKEWGIGDEIIIGYSGNLGRAHAVDTIIELVSETRSINDLRFIFIGGGAGLAKLKAALGEDIANGRVLLRPYQDRSRLSESLSIPDFHIVSLDPACDGLIFPSKVYGILAAQREVVALSSESGALAELVRKQACGFCLPIGAGHSEARDKVMSKLLSRDFVHIRKRGSDKRETENSDFAGHPISQWCEVIAATGGLVLSSTSSGVCNEPQAKRTAAVI